MRDHLVHFPEGNAHPRPNAFSVLSWQRIRLPARVNGKHGHGVHFSALSAMIGATDLAGDRGANCSFVARRLNLCNCQWARGYAINSEKKVNTVLTVSAHRARRDSFNSRDSSSATWTASYMKVFVNVYHLS